MSAAFDDEARLTQLAVLTAVWTVVWSLVLLVVPPGASGRNHIVSLNAAHGVVCTLVATATLWFGLATINATAISVAFFLVDLAAMLNADGISNLHKLNQSRIMDYAHHVLGIFWGSLFIAHDGFVCDARIGNPYTWIQTNEVSTPFYNWFRLTNNKIAGALFAWLFFLSRIAFNTLFLIPRIAESCDVRYLLGCLPYFALQYVWFAMIVKKMLRSSSTSTKRTSENKKTE